MKSLVFLVALAWAMLLHSRNAYAYIDPGTGSYVVQLIIAGIVGVAVSVKVFFHRIRAALGSTLGNPQKRTTHLDE